MRRRTEMWHCRPGASSYRGGDGLRPGMCLYSCMVGMLVIAMMNTRMSGVLIVEAWVTSPSIITTTTTMTTRGRFPSSSSSSRHHGAKSTMDTGDSPTPTTTSKTGGDSTTVPSTSMATPSQGLVSALTGLVNAWSDVQSPWTTTTTTTTSTTTTSSSPSLLKPRQPPQSTVELQDRIRQDYETNNYLWTGRLDISCFDPQCTFTDPTLSFVGTDTFCTNTQNLVPWVERFVTNSQSILLDIDTVVVGTGTNTTTTINPIVGGYVQTRWNMVGDLPGLFWKPQINVIGRTKFWFRTTNTNTNTTSSSSSSSPSLLSTSPAPILQVYEYDEEWEIPAYQALLQLVTPTGTFPNTLRT